MSAPTVINVKVQRYSPDAGAPAFQEYEVPIEPGMSVMNILTYIYENLDSSLSHYTSCRIGKCLGCDVGINGETDYACTTPVRGDLTITPLPEFVPVKDLLIDRDRPKRPAGKKPVIA
ncbi:MAG TPA: 2Fe-2S iron-sulfur cluster-binding protein [Rhodospirillales bacterium]|jgi:succinate dehydrogenase/fumarate reductase-like Fe-S protein|nr:2Fe-2S iron-sulfur cluster-binding protein [Rhodospirillales bacterium]